MYPVVWFIRARRFVDQSKLGENCRYADVQIGAMQPSVDIYKFNEERAECALTIRLRVLYILHIPQTDIYQTQVLSRM